MFWLFFKDNWEAIAIAAIIGAVAISFHHVKTQRDEARATLSTLQTFYTAKLKESENKLAVAKVTQQSNELIAQKQISELNIDRDTLTNAIRSYYANKPAKPFVVHPSGGVLPSATGTSSSETPTSGEGSTGSGQISWSTCSGLEAENKDLTDALILETIDYNRARERIDQDCAQVGCE
jgi:hypothetical protein